MKKITKKALSERDLCPRDKYKKRRYGTVPGAVNVTKT